MAKRVWVLLVAVVLGCALVGVAAKPKRKKASSPPSPPPAPTGPFELASQTFEPGGVFPLDNRGDEDDVSPALTWRNAPVGTEAFVLIADEVDESGSGSSRTNWLVYDIPLSVTELREELSGAGASDVARLGMKEEAGQEPVVVDPMESMMSGMGMGGYEDPEMTQMRQMISGAVDAGYDAAYRAKEGKLKTTGRAGYHGPTGKGTVTFKMYALTDRLGLEPGASKEQVLAAMKGKVLGKATLSARTSS